jgi:DNA-binding LacI/PurR family transcriptional regulator
MLKSEAWKTDTTVRQPLTQMAEVVVRFLLERISGYEGEVGNIRLSNDLVLRGSTPRRPAALPHLIGEDE